MHLPTQVSLRVFLLVLNAVGFWSKRGAELREVNDDKFKPGQVWSYKTRANEEASALTILRVDEYAANKRIVHIRVDNVHLKNCTGGPAPETFEHMPFSKESMDESVIKTLRTGNVPDFHNGYSGWRAAWDAGTAGYYAITVAQALDVAQKTFDQSLGCPK
jgi:hypothetical protein